MIDRYELISINYQLYRLISDQRFSSIGRAELKSLGDFSSIQKKKNRRQLST